MLLALVQYPLFPLTIDPRTCRRPKKVLRADLVQSYRAEPATHAVNTGTGASSNMLPNKLGFLLAVKHEFGIVMYY